MEEVAVGLDDHEVVDRHRAGHRDAAHVVAAEVDEHDVLGALLGVRQQPLDGELVAAASPLRRAVPAIGRMVAVRPSSRRNSSGLAPTTTRPAIGSRLMYGLGLRSRMRR